MNAVLEILKNSFGCLYLGHNKNIITVYTNMYIFYKVFTSSSMKQVNVPDVLKEYVINIRITDEIIVDPNFEVLKEDRNAGTF